MDNVPVQQNDQGLWVNANQDVINPQPNDQMLFDLNLIPDPNAGANADGDGVAGAGAVPPGGGAANQPPGQQQPGGQQAGGQQQPGQQQGANAQQQQQQQQQQQPQQPQPQQAGVQLANLQTLETDMTSHLWFEMDRFKGKSIQTPVTHSVTEWLTYWEAKMHVIGANRSIEKAINYICPASRAVFNDAIAMSRLQHNRNDFDLFKNTVKRTFQVTKGDVVTHPLRDNNWLLRLPQQGRQTPRNQALRIFCNVARKPLKQLSSMLFDANRNFRRAQFVHAHQWLQDMRLIPQDLQLVQHLQRTHRACALIGMAWAIQLQALQTFRFNNVPVQISDQYADLMEEHLHLRQNCNVDVMEGLMEELATFLTTQHGIHGPSLADKQRNIGNQAAAIQGSGKGSPPKSQGDTNSPGKSGNKSDHAPNDKNKQYNQELAAINNQRGRRSNNFRGRGRGGRGGRHNNTRTNGQNNHNNVAAMSNQNESNTQEASPNDNYDSQSWINDQ